MDLFEKLNQEGVTIVMITHDPQVASRAKRIVDIFDGMISERGKEEADQGSVKEEVNEG